MSILSLLGARNQSPDRPAPQPDPPYRIVVPAQVLSDLNRMGGRLTHHISIAIAIRRRSGKGPVQVDEALAQVDLQLDQLLGSREVVWQADAEDRSILHSLAAGADPGPLVRVALREYVELLRHILPPAERRETAATPRPDECEFVVDAEQWVAFAARYGGTQPALEAAYRRFVSAGQKAHVSRFERFAADRRRTIKIIGGPLVKEPPELISSLLRWAMSQPSTEKRRRETTPSADARPGHSAPGGPHGGE